MMKENPHAIEVILSKERTLLSNEQTAISLSQLALGVAAFGFFVIRFFADEPDYRWFMALGIGSVVLSALLAYHAWHDYKHYRAELCHLHNKRGHLDKLYVDVPEE